VTNPIEERSYQWPRRWVLIATLFGIAALLALLFIA
jgi:hypothetical protein